MRQSRYKTNSSNAKPGFAFNQNTALGGTTLVLFGYIVYHFIFPLISKGLLF